MDALEYYVDNACVWFKRNRNEIEQALPFTIRPVHYTKDWLKVLERNIDAWENSELDVRLANSYIRLPLQKIRDYLKGELKLGNQLSYPKRQNLE